MRTLSYRPTHFPFSSIGRPVCRGPQISTGSRGSDAVWSFRLRTCPGPFSARDEGVDPLLVTCDDDNTASASIIERLGGILEDVRQGSDGIAKRRYWID